MQLAEIESKANNNYMSLDEIEDLLNNPPRIQTMQDAMRRISRLETCLRSQQTILRESTEVTEETRFELKYQTKRAEMYQDKLDIYRNYR